ncbi:efflux transporter outer membrane subunit [Pelomonas sp. KK5]|uniref:efflux transporter outer membrane subunit n=1 Tax=Pelomonas sp. KK5 TaxID=1855730 RepID=UPI001E2AF471|nr:efflux transporter outer membrane subunit [Pelomonas sp. KK5]
MTLRFTPLALAALLSACAAVGPDYQGPPIAPSPAGFVRADATQARPGPVAAAWWRSLNDPALDALVDQALKQSPTLQAAEARLRAARATLRQQEANAKPKGSASAIGAGVWQGPTTDQSSTIQLYSVGFDATWEVDLFGGTRRATEAASAQAQAVQADLADAQVSLAAEVASTYVGLRGQQARQALLRDTAAFDAQALALTRQRREAGVATADEVEQRTQQGDATQAALADVAADIAASLDRLALLTGQAPGTLDAEMASGAAVLPSVPAGVAIGDPASLLQRRPDIRAAERRLAGRTAQIGQQTANYFPKLTLLGNVGVASTDAGQLLRASNLALAAVPYLSWNFLDFGRTTAAVHQAEANRDEAVANYQAAVLTALQDANTALSRFGQRRQSVQSLQAQQASAGRTLALTQQRRAAGASSQIDLLDARRREAEAQGKALDGEAALLKDFVALQKSLGLGWQ